MSLHRCDSCQFLFERPEAEAACPQCGAASAPLVEVEATIVSGGDNAPTQKLKTISHLVAELGSTPQE